MAEQSVTLAPGESKQVSFETTPHEARTYQVSVNGLTGSFVAMTPIPVEVVFSPIGGAIIVNWEDLPVSYRAVHDAISGKSIGAAGYIGQVRDEWGWLISRGFLVFETRSLPKERTIISAILSIYIFRLDLCEIPDLVVVQTGSYFHPGTTPILSDFDHRYYSGDGGSISTAALHLGYIDIPLTEEGLGFIKKSGDGDRTRLTIRSSKDINSIAPSRSEMVGAYLGPASEHPPILTIVTS